MRSLSGSLINKLFVTVSTLDGEWQQCSVLNKVYRTVEQILQVVNHRTVFQQADATIGILNQQVHIAQRRLFATGEGAE